MTAQEIIEKITITEDLNEYKLKKWTLLEDFDINKVSLGERNERTIFLYKYDESVPSDLHLCFSNDVNNFCEISKPKKIYYNNVDTKKRQMSIKLESNYHFLLEKILHELAKKFENETNKKINDIPLKKMDKYAYVYCGIIESKTGKVYTNVYNKDQKVFDINDIANFHGRPCISINVTNHQNIKCSIVEAYVDKFVETVKFGLALKNRWNDF